LSILRRGASKIPQITESLVVGSGLQEISVDGIANGSRTGLLDALTKELESFQTTIQGEYFALSKQGS